jgi:VanZ family protein
MLKIHADAQKLVDQWTKGLSVVTTIQPFPDTLVTVSKDDRERYHVTAYFTIGATWHTSADAQGVTADEAFKAVSKRLTQ